MNAKPSITVDPSSRPAPSAAAPAAHTDAPAAEFAAAWDDLARVVRRARGRESRKRLGGLTISQFHLLDALEQAGSLTVRELAEAAGVTSPTTTRMLDTLERHSIVARRPAPDDGRAVEVRLTPSGRRAVGAARDRLRQAQHAVFDELKPDERQQATSLLRDLASAIAHLESS